ISFEEYAPIDGWQLLETLRLTTAELNAWRRSLEGTNSPWFKNAVDLPGEHPADTLPDRFYHLLDQRSMLAVPIRTGEGKGMSITFYSSEPDSYNNEHIELLGPLRPQMTTVLEKIRQHRESLSTAHKAASHTTTGDHSRQPLKKIVGNSTKLLQVLDQVSL